MHELVERVSKILGYNTYGMTHEYMITLLCNKIEDLENDATASNEKQLFEKMLSNQLHQTTIMTKQERKQGEILDKLGAIDETLSSIQRFGINNR